MKKPKRVRPQVNFTMMPWHLERLNLISTVTGKSRSEVLALIMNRYPFDSECPCCGLPIEEYDVACVGCRLDNRPERN